MKRWIIAAVVLTVPVGYAAGDVAGHLAPRPLTVQQEIVRMNQPSVRPDCGCRVILLPDYLTREVPSDHGRELHR